MGLAGAADAGSCWNRPAAEHRPAHGGERDLLRSVDGLSVAGTEQGLSTALDRAGLLLSLARRRDLALHQSHPGEASTRGGRTEGHAIGLHHRQSEREDHGKWRSTRL